MATFGGIFKVFNSQWSNPATPDTKYYDCKAWGIVIDAPEEKAKKKPPYSPYVIFWLKVRRKLNIECFVYQDDNPYAFAIARLLRPGDPVDISGNLREIIHTVTKGKKAGTERIERQMSVHTISPQRIVTALMEEADRAIAPDAIAGLDEYLKIVKKRSDGGEGVEFDQLDETP